MKNIIYCGQFTDASGYGSAARKYLKILDKFLDKNIYNLRVCNSSYENKIYCSNEDLEIFKKYELKSEDIEVFIECNDYTAIFHLLPWDIFLEPNPRQKNNLIWTKASKRINASYWEADRLPKKWREIFSDNSYDEIVLACEWNKQIYQKDVKQPIHVIPLPIKQKNVKKIANNTFNIFSLSQWQPRKGFDVLIKAFYQEFFYHDDVKLIIKTYDKEANGVNKEQDSKTIIKEAINYKNSCVHYSDLPKCKFDLITGIVTEQELQEIYSQASIFCLTSRGEGFSLPIAEAAVSGIPVVVGENGGHVDYLCKENNFFFKDYLKPVDCMPRSLFFSSCEMNFIEPDVLSLRKQLRKAYEIWKKDPKLLDELGKNSQNFTSNFLGEEKIFKSLIKVF